MKERILVIGACGQIGVELTLALREKQGNENVVAADLREEHALLKGKGTYHSFDVLDKEILRAYVIKEQVTEIYLLAAALSATGERYPLVSWKLNMQGLLNVLEIAREQKISKIFWPSSIAKFGLDTVYGISKQAGEHWCNYYFHKYGVDVRSLRYPGLISYKTAPGGGTTDYAIEIFHKAVEEDEYTCFLKEDTKLPMMYMDDAVRATLQLMEAPVENITVRTSYNISAMSFSPGQLAEEIRKHNPAFTIHYNSDYRQAIADGWPPVLNDAEAKKDWNWSPEFDIARMTHAMYGFVSAIHAQNKQISLHSMN